MPVLPKPFCPTAVAPSLTSVAGGIIFVALTTPLAHKQRVTFVELHGFAKRVNELLDDESLLGLEIEIARNPETGALIKNGGGLRKVRWAAKGHGKSGGVRVIYYWRTAAGEILLVAIYPKNEKENLSDKELANLRKQIEK